MSATGAWSVEWTTSG